MMNANNPNRELIDGMRMLAEWLESHPEVGHCCSEVQLNFFPDDLAKATKGLGLLKKEVYGDWFSLVKRFSPQVHIEWCKRRDEVCDRVKVGTKIVPAQPERKLPAEPEKVVDVFEWKCPDSILAACNRPEDADGPTLKIAAEPEALEHDRLEMARKGLYPLDASQAEVDRLKQVVEANIPF